MASRWIFLVALSSTLYMTGVIWFVQVVHYYLFNRVGGEQFSLYEQLHTVRTGWVVAPVMLLELGSAMLLLVERPSWLPAMWVYIILGLTIAVWLSTFGLQVPQHARLQSGFDTVAYQRLVSTNWWRTLFWTLKSLILIGWTYQGMAK